MTSLDRTHQKNAMVRELLMKVELNKMNTSQGMKEDRIKLDEVGCGGESL